MEQEAEVWKLIREAQTDVVVLARYMQVLSTASPPSSPDAASTFTILPLFKGAAPITRPMRAA